MNSLRERILQALMTLLQPVAQANGAALIRSPPVGIPREQSPALLLFPESDGIASRPNDRVERHLVLRMTALARDQGSESAFVIADRLLVAAHAALFANANFDDLALGLMELECEWESEGADAQAAAIPARYQITYRTLATDISQQG
jgi:hypothetical protein